MGNLESVERRIIRLIGKDAEIRESDSNTDLLNTEIETILLNTIKNDTHWLQLALKDFSFKFSIEKIKKDSAKYVKKILADKKRIAVESNKINILVDAYLDIKQGRWGTFEKQSHMSRSMKSPENKNWKYFLKLLYIMRKLGIKSKKEMRMYIKGVHEKKGLGNYKYRLPLKLLSSPYCVLDFLIYLKENWYERHSQSLKREPEYRERDFGQTHYMRLANQALGFLRDTIKRNRGSIFSSEIPSSLGLGEEKEEFWAYYIIACSKVTRVFWKKGWLEQLSPKVCNNVNKLRLEYQSNPSLKRVLQFTKGCANDLWEESGLPMYGENDDFHLMWIVSDNPKLEQEIKTWIKS